MRNLKNLPHKTMNLLLTILLVILIMATPALADVVANSVGSLQIIDRSIQAIDIRAGAIKTKKIANGAVRNAKIANGAVNSAKIADGSITNADVAAGAAIAASKINRTGLDADLLDGKDSGAFVSKSGDQTMAGKLTASSLSYSGPKTGYLSINPAAFNSDNSTNSYDGLVAGQIHGTGTGSTQYFVAPVQLPHGAIVKSVRFRAYDNHMVFEYLGQMIRWSSSGNFTFMASAGSSATSALWQLLEDTSIGSAQIDNQNYDYTVMVRLQPTAGQVMITYETSGP